MKTMKILLAEMTRRVAGLALGVGMTAAALAAASPLKAEPALWVVRDADSTIYLFGTVHALRETTVWRTPKIEQALSDSREVWVEIAEIGDAAQQQAAMVPLMQSLGMDPGRPLSSKLDAPDRERLKQAAAKLNVPLAQLEPLRPWLAAVQLSVLPVLQAGYDPEAGVDTLVAQAAKARNKPLKAFETPEQQVRFFADLPESVELQLLHEALDDAEDGPAMIDALGTAWAAGDMTAFGTLFLDDMRAESPQLYKVLIADRNTAWAATIQAWLKGSGTTFVAVGAGHLVGPDSVRAKLEARGVYAERR